MGKSGQFWMPTLLCVFIATPAAAQTTGLLGDPGGVRARLADIGITLTLTDTENLLGNLAGGVKQGATMQGVTTGTLEIDTGKAFGVQGGTFHISALQIHGQPLSPAYLDDLQTANGNEAEDTTRLWEFWFDQSFDYTRADIKLGQQSIDNEFIVSQYSGLFVNTMAGWPLIPSDDLYGGGPAYPLASLGVRGQIKPSDNTTVLAGVFDDNPGGGAFANDAQALDATGAKFNLRTGALFIAELQYSINQPQVGDLVQSAQPPSSYLPGTYKIGFWYDTGSFPDARFATTHDGDYSLYAVADQTIWQSNADSSRGLNVFARVMGAPDNQNLIDFSLNGGLTFTAPFCGRDNDQAGIDFGIGKVSTHAAQADRDQALPAQTTEELFELTYQAQLAPWLTMQPDLQYIIHPGAGVLDPVDLTHLLRNEFVAGVRGNVTF